MRLILLLGLLFVIYSICSSMFFWRTLIVTLRLYAAGDDIYDFVKLDDTPNATSTVHIPLIMHRTWANDAFLKQYNLEVTQHFNHCLELYSRKQWTTILWTDDSIRSFLQKHYPQFLPTFDEYRFTIQRVDAARYFILYHYGGVYMDMDIGCSSTKDIGNIVSYMEVSGKQVALPQTEPIGVSNDVMFASKNSAFFKEAIDTLPTKNRWFGIHYLTVLYSTGSLFVSLLYFSQKPPEKRPIAIIPPRLYSEKGTSYFRHFRGNTWHYRGEWVFGYWFVLEFVLFFMLLLLLWMRLRPLRLRRKLSKKI